MAKKKNNYKVILFDFDGTLADTIELVRTVSNELSEIYHFKKVQPEEVRVLKKLDLKGFTKYLGIKKRYLPIILAKGQLLFRRHLADIELFPDMSDVLRDLKSKGFRLGILTSNDEHNVKQFLEQNNLKNHFDFVYAGAKLGGKAHHLKMIRRRHKLRRTELLYVGDEIRDVKASHRARIDIAAVSWGFNTQERLEMLKPKFLLKEPKQLLETLS